MGEKPLTFDLSFNQTLAGSGGAKEKPYSLPWQTEALCTPLGSAGCHHNATILASLSHPQFNYSPQTLILSVGIGTLVLYLLCSHCFP
jgi:hypothetical protein